MLVTIMRPGWRWGASVVVGAPTLRETQEAGHPFALHYAALVLYFAEEHETRGADGKGLDGAYQTIDDVFPLDWAVSVVEGVGPVISPARPGDAAPFCAVPWGESGCRPVYTAPLASVCAPFDGEAWWSQRMWCPETLAGWSDAEDQGEA